MQGNKLQFQWKWFYLFLYRSYLDIPFSLNNWWKPAFMKIMLIRMKTKWLGLTSIIILRQTGTCFVVAQIYKENIHNELSCHLHVLYRWLTTNI
jgi:hypothetical protein